MIVDVVIPALDEEEALPKVLRDLPATVRRVVVCDNGSTDRTAEVARAGGAVVVVERERGYGAACLTALAHLRADPPDVVVFLDADHSDDPRDLPVVLEPIASGAAELVIGSRVRGTLEPGALTWPQRVGNAIACGALRAFYRARYTDLGPFRAVTWAALEQLEMEDRNFGWTVEMQIKAARLGIAHAEVAVAYRRRGGGQSKVSGTIEGSVRAGTIILWQLAKHAR